jgi:glycosyltransferase involved in cell wall biosynthesis
VLNAAPEDIALLHLSIGSPVNDVFAGLPCRKAILYHNITPPRYFRLVQPKTAYDLATGFQQVKSLRCAAAVTMADSRFNAGELEEMGYRDVKVLPLIAGPEGLDGPADRWVRRELSDGRANILFVGRCAPNKKIEDALTAFFYFQKHVEPHSRFIHVGGYHGTERYYSLLISLARDLQLKNVLFAGAVTQADLNAYYQCARLFLCMSEHEGFCMPLIEGMARDVPVMAFAAGAVPETMDGAGCLFREKRFPEIAEMMGHLVRDTPLRSAVIAGQRERLARYTGRDVDAELRALLSPLLALPPDRSAV